MSDEPRRVSFLDWLGIPRDPDWTKARPIGRLVGLALAGLLLMALVAAVAVVVTAIFDPGSAGFGTGAVLVALLGAPFLIWRTVIAQTTLGYQKEGHITDRINKAVEMLGAEKEVKRAGDEETVPNIEVRMGAILSLERIAQDSTRFDAGRDHVRVMEILCAYIRENSNAQTPEDYPEPDWEPLKDDATEAERDAHVQAREERFGAAMDLFRSAKAREWAKGLTKPRADVQLALTVIGRRGADQRRVEAAWPDPPTEATVWPFDPDFTRLPDDPGDAALSKAELDAFEADMARWKQTISRERYRGYRLDLRGANLQRADMAAKRPDGADAVFSGARLEGARMEGADLVEARMEGADLREARMEGAVLALARMEGAVLGGARMEGAVLGGARMEGANLEHTRMEEADLREARMDARTSLTAASLRGAAARDANWESIDISAEQVNSIFGDASVTLPGGVTPGHADWPAHWPVWALPFIDPAGGPDFRTEWRKWQDDPAGYVPPPPGD